MNALVLVLLVTRVAAAPAGAADTGKIQIAVMDLTAPKWLSAAVVASLTTTMSETVDSLGAFSATSNDDIRRMLDFESQKQLLGCEDSTLCLAELGGALGVSYTVSGTITALGNDLSIQLQLTNIKETRVESRESRQVSGEIAGLAKEMRAATTALMQPLLDKRKGGLAVSVNEDGATVRVDGRIVGVSPLVTVELASGYHEVLVELEGFVTAKGEVTIRPEQRTDAALVLLPSAEYARQRYESAARTRLWSYIAGGTGAVALAASVGLFVVGGQKASALNADIATYNAQGERPAHDFAELDEREREIASYDLMTLAAAGVAVLGVGAGIILYATGDDPTRFEPKGQVAPAPPRATVALGLTPYGVALTGSF
jgi:hypothetical protein